MSTCEQLECPDEAEHSTHLWVPGQPEDPPPFGPAWRWCSGFAGRGPVRPAPHPLDGPAVVFSPWELHHGAHPTEQVRRLGIAMQRAYFRAIGREDVLDRAIATDRRAGYDTDHDRRARWDRAAAEVLAWQAEHTDGLGPAIRRAHLRANDLDGERIIRMLDQEDDPPWRERWERIAAEVAAWQATRGGQR